MREVFNKYKDRIFLVTIGNDYEEGYLKHEWNDFVGEAIEMIEYANKLNIKVFWAQLTLLFIGIWCKGCSIDEEVKVEELMEVCKDLAEELQLCLIQDKQ